MIDTVSRVAAIVVIAALSRSAHAETKADRQRTTRLVAAGIAGLVFAGTETVFKDTLSPDMCRWCGVDGFDASVRDTFVWGNTRLADQLSNLTGYVMSPLGGAGLLLFSTSSVESGRWLRLADDLIPMFETVAYSQLIVQTVKFSVGRQRPFVHFAQMPVEPDPDHNLSFFSGHSALTFSIAVSTGIVASRRGYALAPVVWSTGLGLATLTAYLRIAADKHYATDVLVGSAFGIACGVAIPRFTGSLPEGVALVPTGNGASVVGQF